MLDLEELAKRGTASPIRDPHQGRPLVLRKSIGLLGAAVKSLG